MKAFTKNLIYYMVFFTISSIVFRFSLSHFLDTRSIVPVWISAALYFILNFALGWIFGSRDRETLPLYDIGFRFHCATYLLFNTISVLWFVSGFHSRHESIRTVYFTALVWGFFVLLHFIFYLLTRRNAIMGIEKSEIFE